MPRPIIDEEECSGCGSCVDVCPNSILELDDDIVKATNVDDCDACSTCAEECPMECIAIEEG